MPSPFPGMNPFLEQDNVWHDFHEKALPAIAERLVAQVRPNSIVKIDEHIYVHETVEPPARDVERLAFAEIRDRQTRELITVIELLSPSNKRPGCDRDQYLAKRESLLAGRVHLVELDLLRGGRPMPMTGRPECVYSALVSRAGERPAADFWPLGLRDRLPRIPIPLRNADENAWLDLQEVVKHVYDVSGYEDYIYQGRPAPALGPDDDAWALAIVPNTAR